MAGLSALFPLIVLFVILGVAAFIGYALYEWSNELADKASKQLESKNMSFTKDGGLRVGVKELKDENYADKTQNVLVNVWNNASFPNYRSHLGWNKSQAKIVPQQSKSVGPGAAVSSSSSSSSSAAAARTRVPRADLPPQVQYAPGQRRSGQTVPGGW